MNSIEQFFLMCSGANATILKKSPTDINKYIGIGATIFFTGLLAMIYFKPGGEQRSALKAGIFLL